MTPEKRPAEEEDDEQVAKKLKEDADAEEEDTTSNNSLDTAKQPDQETNGAVKDEKELEKKEENSGTLVFCGCCQWEFVGRRKMQNIPAMQHFSPRCMKSFSDIKVKHVASHCSAVHSVIITKDGKTMTVGRNEKGQLGIGDCEEHSGPQIVEALEDVNIVAAAVGKNHSLFLTDDGIVYACGNNKNGQCGVGNTSAVILTPIKINLKDTVVTKIACGADFSMIVDKYGRLYSFGSPEYGQLGHNTDGKFFVTGNKITYRFETSPRRVPVFVERSKNGHATPITDVHIVGLSCGVNHTVVIDSHKRAFSWGFGGYGRLGHAGPKDEMMPRLVKFFDGNKRGVNQVHCGGAFCIAQTELGVFLWGQNKRTGEANMYPKPVPDLYGWTVRSVGCSNNSIVLAADESVIAWGPSPTYGELGLGETTKSSTTPKEVKLLDGLHIHQVSCGMGHTFLIVRDEEDKDKEILNKLKVIDL